MHAGKLGELAKVGRVHPRVFLLLVCVVRQMHGANALPLVAKYSAVSQSLLVLALVIWEAAHLPYCVSWHDHGALFL